MSILDRIISSIGGRAIEQYVATMSEAVKAAPANYAAYGPGYAWIHNITTTGSGGWNDDPMGRIDAASLNVWAANCVAARANAISSVRMVLYKPTTNAAKARATWRRRAAMSTAAAKPFAVKALDMREDCEPVEDHPVVDLLRDVNSVDLNEVSLREQIERSLSIHGDFLAKKVRGTSGKPEELYIVPIPYVEPLPSTTTLVAGYRYKVGQGEIIAPEDIIRIYYRSDKDPLQARSPTSTALASINSYAISDTQQRAIDKHGGQGGGIIMMDANSLAVDIERFMQKWNSDVANPEKGGLDRSLPPGSDYKSGVLTAVQQQKEQRAARLAKEIMAGYTVPPSLAGDYSDASVLANAAQQSTNFWQTFVLAELRRIEEVFTYSLLWQDWPETKEAGWFFAHDISDIPALQDDALKESQVKQAYVETAARAIEGAVWSVNEGRAYTGRSEIDNPAANTVILLTNKPDAETVDAETGATVTPEPEPQAATTTTTPAPAFEDDIEDDDDEAAKAYNEDQPRDERGRFASGGGGASAGEGGSQREGRASVYSSIAGDNPNVEAVVVIDKNGTVIGSGIGDAGSADIPSSSLLHEAGAGIEIIHNHPDGSGLSPQDLKVFDKYSGVDTITAVSDGRVYSASIIGDRRELSKAVDEFSGTVREKVSEWASEYDSMTSENKADLRRRRNAEIERIGKSMQDRGLISLSVSAVKSETLLPVIDFVGQTALLPDGTRGTIEAIKRFGEHGGLTATKAAPVVVVGGVAYAADAVKVVMQ